MTEQRKTVLLDPEEAGVVANFLDAWAISGETDASTIREAALRLQRTCPHPSSNGTDDGRWFCTLCEVIHD